MLYLYPQSPLWNVAITPWTKRQSVVAVPGTWKRSLERIVELTAERAAREKRSKHATLEWLGRYFRHVSFPSKRGTLFGANDRRRRADA